MNNHRKVNYLSSSIVQYIYRVRANQYVAINEVSSGDIVAIAGFTNTQAGSTLTLQGDEKFVL